MPAVQQQPLTAPRPAVPALAVPRVLAGHWALLAVLALAALSFVFPSAPTYDPWAWIIWGRETLHLDLSTVDGPSWKPLPVLFTTPFALTGDLAPELWLFVARAGALGGVVLAFRLARRLGGLPAGAAAAAAYGLAPWTIRNGTLGNSEGLLVALALWAVERHVQGRPRWAFALGLGAALLRPEAWPLLGLYGLWLAWREPAARALVAAGFASLPLLWLVPEWLGSGDLLRAAHRAQNPNANSPAFADDPVLAVLEQFTTMLPTLVWLALGAFAVMGVVALWRARGASGTVGAAAIGRARGGSPARPTATALPGRGELALAGALLGGAVVWIAEVALMTSDGFSGNARYLILPAALLCVLGGAGVGWALRALRLPGRGAGALALAAVAGAVFASPAVNSIGRVAEGLRYQARLSDGLATAVARAGGPDRILPRGRPYSGRFQVPAVAWYLEVHTSRVGLFPRTPGVVFRARNDSRSRPMPGLVGVGGERGVETLAIAGGWRILASRQEPR